MTLIVIYENTYISANTIPKMCQALVNRGLAIHDREFHVYRVLSGEKIAIIRYDKHMDMWMQMPIGWRAIKGTREMRSNKPKVEE